MVGLMKKEDNKKPSLDGSERKTNYRTKIEYVTCPMTGTVEEMEVEDEDLICPVIREYEKYKT
jgi:hypothetical protein